MASQLTRTFLHTTRIVRTFASQANKGPMDYVRQGVDQLNQAAGKVKETVTNAISNEDPQIEKAAKDFKEAAKGAPSSQPSNASGDHAPAVQAGMLKTAGGRATTQSRNYSSSSDASGGYGGSGTTKSQSSPGKKSTSSDQSTGHNAGGSASQQSEGSNAKSSTGGGRQGTSDNQSGGYGGSGSTSKPQKRDYSSSAKDKSSSSSSAVKGSDGLGGYAGSSSASGHYSSTTKGTESSGPPKQPTGGYGGRDEQTTDKTMDKKAPPSS